MPQFNSFRNELLVRRSRLSGITLDRRRTKARTKVGLLVLLGGFVADLACVAAVVSVVEYLLTSHSSLVTSWSVDWPVVAIVVAIHGLSAAVGTAWQLAWLRSHRSGAAQAGVIAGAFSAIVFAFLAWLSASVPQIEARALEVARYFALMGPGLIVALYTRALRRKQLAWMDL